MGVPPPCSRWEQRRASRLRPRWAPCQPSVCKRGSCMGSRRCSGRPPPCTAGRRARRGRAPGCLGRPEPGSCRHCRRGLWGVWAGRAPPPLPRLHPPLCSSCSSNTEGERGGLPEGGVLPSEYAQIPAPLLRRGPCPSPWSTLDIQVNTRSPRSTAKSSRPRKISSSRFLHLLPVY